MADTFILSALYACDQCLFVRKLQRMKAIRAQRREIHVPSLTETVMIG